MIKGDDRTKDILKATLASDAELHDSLLGTKENVKLQQDIYKILGVWPSTGDDHLAEFYQYFYTPRRLEQHPFHAIKKLQPGREPFGRTAVPKIIHDWAYGPELIGDLHLLTSEHAHELMWSIFSGEPFTRVLNVLNTGEYLKDISKDACVEVLMTTNGKKRTGGPSRRPDAAHSLVLRCTTIHELTVKAAKDCDRDAALQALFLDSHTLDMYDIEPMLEDFLTVLKPWMPEKWYR